MTREVTAIAAALALVGCASYNPRDLAELPTDELCYVEYMQRPNLSTESRQAIQRELQRRNDTCAKHATAVARKFQDFMYVETYGRQSP